MSFQYIFLSSQFYKDYPPSHFPEILRKLNRPHIMFLIKIENIDFAIPFRSKINHRYAFLTSLKERKGIDYSKAIVISDTKYIFAPRKIYVDKKEHGIILENEETIFNEFSKYVKDYKKVLSVNVKTNKYKFSTLQYFKKELTSKLTSQSKQISADKNSNHKNKFSL
jgi:protein AbiQ